MSDILNVADIIKLERRRNFSDDLGILFYGIAWFVVGMYFLFMGDSLIDAMNYWYLFFDIMAVLFLILNYWIRKSYGALDGFLVSHDESGESQFFDNMAYTIKGCLYSSLIYLFFIVVIWANIYQLLPIRPAQTSDEAIWNFQVFRSIPLEELAFRGLGITLCVFVLAKIFGLDTYLKYHNLIAANDRELNWKVGITYTLIWVISFIAIGIMFGLYHLPKYRTNNPYYPELPIYNSRYEIVGYISVFVPITFLIILGILIGFMRYRWGLLPCIFVHILNNYLALFGVPFSLFWLLLTNAALVLIVELAARRGKKR